MNIICSQCLLIIFLRELNGEERKGRIEIGTGHVNRDRCAELLENTTLTSMHQYVSSY